MGRTSIMSLCLFFALVAVVAVVRGRSAARTPCDLGNAASTSLPASGDYPLSVSVQALSSTSDGSGTYTISLTNTSQRSVRSACLTLTQQTRGLTGQSGSKRTSELASGTVRASAKLKEVDGASGTSYELLVNDLRPGSTVTKRVVATAASVEGADRQACLVVGALMPRSKSAVAGSIQEVCTFPGKKPLSLLPIEISLSGPAETHAGRLTMYTVTIRNTQAAPVRDLGIRIAQANPEAKATHYADAVLTDYGQKQGRRRRNEIRLRTLGSAPVTFHIWWRAHALAASPNATAFAVTAYDKRTYPNPAEFVLAELLSPLATG